MATTHPPHSRLPVTLSAVAALLSGLLSSVQARANGELSHVLGAPALASIWSFGSGAVVLTAGLLLPSARRGLRRVLDAIRAQHLRWWEMIGGLFGGFFVAAQTYAVPQVGVAMFTVAIVGGQTVNALLVDRFGLGPAGRVPVTAVRAGAALLTFVGVALAASARGSGQVTTALPLLLAVLAGAGMAFQGAINGKVNRVSGAPLATTWLNFMWGLGFLVALAAVQWAGGHLHPHPDPSPPWWSLVGGVLGVVFIAVNVVTVAHLGVLVMTLMLLTGQLVSAVAMDAMFPTQGSRITGQLILGVMIALLAAAAAALSARPRRP